MAGKGDKVQWKEGFCDAKSCISSRVEASRERGACWCQGGWGEMGQDRDCLRGTEEGGSALRSGVGIRVPALLEVCAVASVGARLHMCPPACTLLGWDRTSVPHLSCLHPISTTSRAAL